MRLRKKIDLSNCTLFELCYAATGSYLQAAKVGAYVISWAAVRRELGREPTKEEYAEHWRINLRQAFYEQARFREAFNGQWETPEALVVVMEQQRAGSGTEGFDVQPLVSAV